MDPESLRDAPLFRELQRVMSSSAGPVQWELARQIAVAGAAEAGAEGASPASAAETIEQAVRVAELRVLDLTGLAPSADVGHIALVRRSEWIAAAMEDYRELVEVAATRLAESLERSLADAPLEPEVSATNPFAALGLGSPQAMIRQLGPLLQATQVGQVFGTLATRVFGGADVGIPHAPGVPLRFVPSNIERFEHDWSLEPREFRTFVALHQVVHRLQFARPWLAGHTRTLVDDFLATMTIDVDAIRDRFVSIAPDPSAIGEALEAEGPMFGVVLDDEQRLRLDRIQALIGIVEGYGDHVVATIARDLLTTYPMIEEAMRRHRDDEELDPIFAQLLGVDVGRDHVARGRRFCDTVVDLTDEATLAGVWTDAESLPGAAEQDEPRLWLARTV
jgi:putative hydrolase